MTYRPEIDGLRAIAVLVVVLFHLRVPGFAGGYVGVDMFFVISGLLITSIIKTKIEADTFRLSDFYFRRIRRLLPPLIVTVAATVAAAALILTPYDMLAFGRTAAAALFSLSNIVFYLEAGYWDTASELKPLLHTWSLGVEEQFYLFWPALILGLVRAQKRVPFAVSTAVLTVAGFALCVWYTGVDQSGAFYLLPLRAFQFLLGALLIPLSRTISAIPGRRQRSLRRWSLWSGLALTAASVALLGDGSDFPGWVVLLPTCGAALCLLSGSSVPTQRVWGMRLLDNDLSVWIGRVSYSMYLVHWPIIALYRYESGIELALGEQLLLALATLAATALLHYGIERRFYQRAGVRKTRRATLTGGAFALRTAGCAALVAIISGSAWLHDGWTWRFPRLQLTPKQISAGMDARFTYVRETCMVHSPRTHKLCAQGSGPTVLVIGNSHEVDGVNFLTGASRGGAFPLDIVRFGSINYCRDLRRENDRLTSDGKNCQERLDALMELVDSNQLDAILYSSSAPFSAPPEGGQLPLLEIIREVKRRRPRLPVAILGGFIYTRVDCHILVNQSGSTDACAEPENVRYFEDDPSSMPLYSDFMGLADLYIDRVDLLCRDRTTRSCRTRTEDGVPALYDRHHQSLEFAVWTGELFSQRHPDALLKLTQGRSSSAALSGG